MRSGYVYIVNGTLGGAAIGGLYWSSTAYSSTGNTYDLNFDDLDVYLSDDYSYHYNGFPVRCLAD